MKSYRAAELIHKACIAEAGVKVAAIFGDQRSLVTFRTRDFFKSEDVLKVSTWKIEYKNGSYIKLTTYAG